MDYNNNCYYNDYNINRGGQLQPQPPHIPAPENGKGGGNFLLGLVSGIALTVLLCGFAFVGVKVYEKVDGRKAAGRGGADSIVNENTEAKLEAIEDVIGEYYYQEADIDVDAMTEGMYAGMVSALGDPYSVYYTEEEWEDLMQETEGIYYGIGAYLMLDPDTGLGKVSGVIENTPAEEAGLRADDLIYLGTFRDCGPGQRRGGNHRPPHDLQGGRDGLSGNRRGAAKDRGAHCQIRDA